MAVNKETWLDLFCLVNAVCLSAENGMTELIYDDPIPCRIHNQTYLLRKALREIGFKIRRVITYKDKDNTIYLLEYQTNIPQGLWKTKRELWDEWRQEVRKEYTDCDTETESECDEEKESVSGDPVV